MDGHMDGAMGWAWWLWPVAMTLLWVTIIAVIIWGVGSLFRHSVGKSQGPTALEILQQRYASGQITREEFEQGRKLLGV